MKIIIRAVSVTLVFVVSVYIYFNSLWWDSFYKTEIIDKLVKDGTLPLFSTLLGSSLTLVGTLTGATIAYQVFKHNNWKASSSLRAGYIEENAVCDTVVKAGKKPTLESCSTVIFTEAYLKSRAYTRIEVLGLTIRNIGRSDLRFDIPKSFYWKAFFRTRTKNFGVLPCIILKDGTSFDNPDTSTFVLKPGQYATFYYSFDALRENKESVIYERNETGIKNILLKISERFLGAYRFGFTFTPNDGKKNISKSFSLKNRNTIFQKNIDLFKTFNNEKPDLVTKNSALIQEALAAKCLSMMPRFSFLLPADKRLAWNQLHLLSLVISDTVAQKVKILAAENELKFQNQSEIEDLIEGDEIYSRAKSYPLLSNMTKETFRHYAGWAGYSFYLHAADYQHDEKYIYPLLMRRPLYDITR